MNPPTPFVFQNQSAPSEPTVLRAGDSWSWSRSFDGYASGAGWTALYILSSAAGRFQFPAGSIVPDSAGYGFTISITGAQTAAIAAGTYELYVVLANAGLGAQQTVLLQSVRVMSNIAGAAGGVDTRSFVKKTLDAIEAAIAGDTSPHVQEYEVAGRRLAYTDRMKLYELRAQYRQEYRAEQIALGEYTPKRRVGVFFLPNY